MLSFCRRALLLALAGTEAAQTPDALVVRDAEELACGGAALLADIGVEVGAMALLDDSAALLADLGVEVEAISCFDRQATLAGILGHGISCHTLPLAQFPL